MNPVVKNKFIEIIGAIFILLFTYTAVSKLIEADTFYSTLKKSPFIEDWAHFLYWLLPLIELITVVLLFIPPVRWAGLYLSLALMMMFTSYISFMLLSAYKLPCSCGGILKKLSWKDHLLLNIILTILAAVAIIFEIKRWRTSNKAITS
jgi:hypothetical protein